MSAGQSYSSAVRPSWQTVRIDRGVQFGGDLTPLHEVVAPSIAKLPGDIAAQLKRDFWKRHDASNDWDSKHAAQNWLANEVTEFEREKITRAFDETEIRALAKRWADLCQRMQRIEVAQDFARSVGVTPPEEKGNVTRAGIYRRLSCCRWWRRQIRKQYTRRAESHLRAAGFVHRRRQVYASDRACEVRRQRSTRNRNLLQELQAVSDAGDQLELWSVVEKSQSNPAIRRAELMTRMRGFEEVAEAAGHVAEFVTLTCPSAFHRTHDNGTRNERWEGFTPKQGQEWLCKQWARARAKLKRLSVTFYGFRIAEPHHDGTPHWHLLCFATAAHIATVREVLSGLWLAEYSNEPGAQKYRTKFVPIVREKGSAAGYIAKYVAKNIDGFQVGEDFDADNKPAIETSERVQAWASTHGIRQFQQIGGPPVTVWRELRRLRSSVDGDATVTAADSIEAARQAADAGEWASYVAASGGIAVTRANRRVRAWMERTGEFNSYDEPRGQCIAGVESDARRVRTRTKVWRIERKKGCGDTPRNASARECSNAAGEIAGRIPSASLSSLGPVSITVRVSDSMPAGSVAGNHQNSGVRGPPWMH